MLSVNGISVTYAGVMRVLHDVSLQVPRGKIIVLLGANGAGKSTTLKAISGLLQVERGEVSGGGIYINETAIDKLDPAKRVRHGITHVMEGRRLFTHLTVKENLLLGAHSLSLNKKETKELLDQVYNYFPKLFPLSAQQAGYLSGGEQQMVALGRALMSKPKLILMDEPSMGLAPVLVQETFDIIRKMNQEQGVSILLAEQNVHMALKHSDYAYILDNGSIALQGISKQLIADQRIQSSYMGMSEQVFN